MAGSPGLRRENDMGSTITGGGRAVSGLGGVAGYGEIQLGRSDDGQLQIDVSAVFEAGLNYFGQRYGAGALWVNTNGSLSFGAAQPAYPTAANSGASADMIAVFWADIDTRLRGEGVESGLIHVDVDPVADVVSITWDSVGAYRRNTDAPNRFQLQLYDRGNGDFDIVLRYEIIGWTLGSAPDDAGARVLLSSALLGQMPLPGLASGSDLATLEDMAGNSGQAGLWIFQMRGGVLMTGAGPAGVLRSGTAGPDRLAGGDGPDTLQGLAGSDTLTGGGGDDFLYGGPDEGDLRDVLYGGAGNDRLFGGGGNDELNGEAGNDILNGGAGADTLIGHAGADTLSGGAGSDLLFGNDGPDFLNGGFGHDRMNGGAGADRFYHLGVADHGSDWVQDYSGAEGDVLVYGQTGAARSQFQVNYTNTPGAGSAAVAEAFVIYKPTGQILWALVDGGGQAAIWLDLGSGPVNLLG